MMETIMTENAPAAIGPYSQAAYTDHTVYVSGQLPVNMKTGELESEITAAAEASLENVKAILKAAGSDLSEVMQTTVYLADMDDFAKMNDVYSRYFCAPYPARVCIAVKQLPKNALIEIACIARRVSNE